MAQGWVDRCIFNAAAGGTADFVVASAVQGYNTPAQSNAVNGTLYHYAAQITQGSSGHITDWEVGTGAYTSGTTTLARTTIEFSSNSNAKVNFSSPPQVMITVLAIDLSVGIPAGPLHSIQSNNPLGTFAGDADFSWTAGAGNTNKRELALGNYATAGKANHQFAPGDPHLGAPGSYTLPTNLVTNTFWQGDLRASFASVPGAPSSILAMDTFDHTGAGSAATVYGVDAEPAISSGNVGAMDALVGIYTSANNFGSGAVTLLYAFNAVANCPDLSSFGVGAQTVGTVAAAVFERWISRGAITDSYGVKIDTPLNFGGGATIAHNYGLYIGDQSAWGSVSYNIYSAGSASRNVFKGSVNLDPGATNAVLANGDMWFNGTNLNFRHAGITSDLLGGGTPGGNTTDIQFNSSGSFSGDDALTYAGSGNATIGKSGTGTGKWNFKGTTSGTVTLSTADAAGTWTLKLPTSAGTNTYVLTTDGSGNSSWTAPGSTANLVVGTSTITSGTTNQLVYDNAGVVGETNILFSAANTLSSPGNELVLEQTGDTLGTTRLRLRSRTGLTGALFENVAIDVVDFGMLPSSGATGNYRFEHRALNLINPINTTGETQDLINGVVRSAFGQYAHTLQWTDSSGGNSRLDLANTNSGTFILSMTSATLTLGGVVGTFSFTNSQFDLCDFVFITSTGNTGHVRLEHRAAGGIVLAANTNGEYEFALNGFNIRAVIGEASHAFYNSSNAKVLDWNDTSASNWTLGAPIVLKSYTVGGLPTGVKGARAFVTDATATTFASVVAGTGGNNVPVYYDGTNWRIG